MAYIIKNSRGETIATLETGTENTSATSITLLGAGFPNYGLQQNENFVYVLENFANVTAPSNPITGQLWFNTANSVLSQRNLGNTWSALATQDYVQAQKISPIFTGVPQAPTAALGTNSGIIATTAFVQNEFSNAGFATLNSPDFTGLPTAPTPPAVNNSSRIATTEYVVNRLNDQNLTPYALKNSPALTGVPTAPTAANGTANTQIATTAFVTSAFNEINLAPYATKASPAFTGVPTAPTAANNTANTQIATTAFVVNYVSDPDLSIYATKVSPTFSGIPQAPTASAATNTNQIATTNFVQLQKASPEFTGSPTAPTPTFSDNSTKLATTQFVQTAISNIPISAASELAGSIKMWASAVPPNNWALCDGQALSRTIYATLFSRIGTTYGAGDGSTTFNVPDFRNRFAVGAGGVYAAGATGGYTDAAVITHTHPVTSSVSINDPGHNHNNVLQATSDNVQRRVTLNRAVGPSGTDAIGSNFGRNTDNATTGITASVSTSVAAPVGAVPGTGRNLPPFLGAYWIIKLSDDGSGGGTLQAGAGIDIATGQGYSTITNTGVKSLTAGTGIGISGTGGNLTITNTGSLPTLTAGQGISIAQNGTAFTITNTVTAPPVIAGQGITVTNTAGGAIVNASVNNIIGGTGINVTNNNGAYTISRSGSSTGSLSAWCSIAYDGFNQPYLAAAYNMRLPITVAENPSDPTPQPGPPQGIGGGVLFYTIPFVTPMVSTGYSAIISFEPNYSATGSGSTSRWLIRLPGSNNVSNRVPFIWWRDTDYIILGVPPEIYQKVGVQSQSLALIHLHIAGGV